MRTLALFLITLGLCLSVAAAATPPFELSEGYRALHNLEFDRAVALFEGEVKREGRNPDAWNHLAHALLYRRLFLAGSGSGEMVGSASFYFRKTAAGMPKEEQARFLEAIERSLALTGERLAAKPEATEALYARGVAYAHRAKFQMLVRRAKLDALRDATRSREAHGRIQELDPAHPDAWLVPGMHEYIASQLPVLARLVARVAGFSGNRERGLAMLEEAVRRGRKTGVEARVLMALVHLREKQPGKALGLMRELSEAFPRNYLYHSEVLLLQARTGERDAALAGLQAMETGRNFSVPDAHLRNLRAAIQRLLENGTRS